MRHWMHIEPPTAEHVTTWREGAQREVQRVGSDELALRLKVPHDALLGFLRGEAPSPPLQVALSVYDFVEYPDLMHLMMGYFYESYATDTGSLANWQAAVDDFVQGSWRGMIIGAAGDIRRLLAATPDDRLQEELVGLGSRFVFHAVPLTPREWIQAVHDRLAGALRAEAPGSMNR
jgi:hypothetical protein